MGGLLVLPALALLLFMAARRREGVVDTAGPCVWKLHDEAYRRCGAHGALWDASPGVMVFSPQRVRSAGVGSLVPRRSTWLALVTIVVSTWAGPVVMGAAPFDPFWLTLLAGGVASAVVGVVWVLAYASGAAICSRRRIEVPVDADADPASVEGSPAAGMAAAVRARDAMERDEAIARVNAQIAYWMQILTDGWRRVVERGDIDSLPSLSGALLDARDGVFAELKARPGLDEALDWVKSFGLVSLTPEGATMWALVRHDERHTAEGVRPDWCGFCESPATTDHVRARAHRIYSALVAEGVKK